MLRRLIISAHRCGAASFSNVNNNKNNVIRRYCSSTSNLPQSPSVSYKDIDFEQCDLRQVPATYRDHLSAISQTPDPFPGSKVLRVSIIGCPNAGKSTLANALIGSQVFATSSKVNTTREKSKGVVIHGPTQMILSDTPGVITGAKKKKHRMEKSLLVDPEGSITEGVHGIIGVDCIMVVVDVGDLRRTRLDPEILYLLHKYKDVPTVLVMTKVSLLKGNTGGVLPLLYDLTKGKLKKKKMDRKMPYILKESKHEKIQRVIAETTEGRYIVPDQKGLPKNRIDQWSHELLDLNQEKIDALICRPFSSVGELDMWHTFRGEIGWANFDDAFIVDSLQGFNIQELKNYLFEQAVKHEWQFTADVATDQSPIKLVTNCIRGKLLNKLPHTIPYSVRLQPSHWEVSEIGSLTIGMTVYVPQKYWVKQIVGPSGETIREVAMEASEDIRNTLKRDVYLRLEVKHVPFDLKFRQHFDMSATKMYSKQMENRRNLKRGFRHDLGGYDDKAEGAVVPGYVEGNYVPPYFDEEYEPGDEVLQHNYQRFVEDVQSSLNEYDEIGGHREKDIRKVKDQ